MAWTGCSWERSSIPNEAQEGSKKTRRLRAVESDSQYDHIAGIVLYGSVARGDADRRSDIDLWVLVEDDRMANQEPRTAYGKTSKTRNSTPVDTRTKSTLNHFQLSRTTSTSSATYSAMASLSTTQRNSRPFGKWSSTVSSMSRPPDARVRPTFLEELNAGLSLL